MKNDELTLPKDFDIEVAETIHKMFNNEFIRSKHRINTLITTVKNLKDFERILPKLKLVDQAAFIIKLLDRLYVEVNNYNSTLGDKITNSQTFSDWSRQNFHYICYSPKQEK